MRKVVDVDRVDNLRRWDVDVCRGLEVRRRLKCSRFHHERLTDDAEIFVETMTDEHAAKINKHAQLLISHLERHKGMSRRERIEITGCGKAASAVGSSRDEVTRQTSNARELGQIVDNSIACVDMIVDEGDAGLLALAAKDRYASECHPTWSYHLLRTIRMELCLLLWVTDAPCQFYLQDELTPRHAPAAARQTLHQSTRACRDEAIPHGPEAGA